MSVIKHAFFSDKDYDIVKVLKKEEHLLFIIFLCSSVFVTPLFVFRNARIT